MPLQRRVPKFGFTNPNRVEFKAINLDTVQELAEKLNLEVIDFQVLKENGLAQKNDLIKILGRGTLTSKVDVTAHKFSASAVAAIENTGGTVTKL
jgi:large subunit ribosomal protein L15